MQQLIICCISKTTSLHLPHYCPQGKKEHSLCCFLKQFFLRKLELHILIFLPERLLLRWYCWCCWEGQWEPEWCWWGISSPFQACPLPSTQKVCSSSTKTSVLKRPVHNQTMLQGKTMQLTQTYYVENIAKTFCLLITQRGKKNKNKNKNKNKKRIRIRIRMRMRMRRRKRMRMRSRMRMRMRMRMRTRMRMGMIMIMIMRMRMRIWEWEWEWEWDKNKNRNE